LFRHIAFVLFLGSFMTLLVFGCEELNMNQPRRLVETAIIVAVLPLYGMNPSMAATFGQAEVKQDKFIAIAVPRAAGYYNLLVLEQLSTKKECWRESGSKPVRVEPLLLNFNFTGICGRATDSNGYSIRVAGQDKGLDYRLSLQKQKDNLVLVGMPQHGKPIELGQTNGLRSGFLKIILSPGWRFAKRTYSGKTLGHVYFSRDTAAPIYQAKAKSTNSSESKSADSKPSESKPSESKSAAAKPTSGRSVDKNSTSSSAYRVMVVEPNAIQQSKLRAQQPGAFRTSYDGQTVMQVGTFSDRAKAESLKKNLKGQGFKVVMVTDPRRASITVPLIASATSGASSWGSLITVPSSSPPIGNARGVKDVYARNEKLSTLPPPPPPPQTLLANRYRVIVMASSTSQQSKVRSLVPGAFRTNYQGQRVMQVGSYRSADEAKSIVALMQRHGFRSITDQI
jgi:cell division protein FtsN